MLGGCLPARFLDRRKTSCLCSGKIDALLSGGSLKLLGRVGATRSVLLKPNTGLVLRVIFGFYSPFACKPYKAIRFSFSDGPHT